MNGDRSKTRDALPTHDGSYPLEVTFPDIRRWRTSASGVDYVHTFDSGASGPHVMVMALTHGNEVSGAIVVDAMLQAGMRPLAGRLTFGFANVDAYHRFDAGRPDANRYVDEDFNRVWSQARLDGNEDSVELRRARALRPVVDDVDLLLDLHSMQEAGAPLMLSGPLDKGIRLAERVGVPQTIVADAGHASGRRMRDYAAFGDPDSPKNALLLESGQHFSASSAAVALDTTTRFLRATTTLTEPALLDDALTEYQPLAQRVLQVTEAVVATGDDFRFAFVPAPLQVIPRAGTVIAFDGAREIVTRYDDCVLVMPSLRHVAPGLTAVRLARTLDRSSID